MELMLFYVALDLIRQAMAAQMEDGAIRDGRAGGKQTIGRTHRPTRPRVAMARLLGHGLARPERGPL